MSTEPSIPIPFGGEPDHRQSHFPAAQPLSEEFVAQLSLVCHTSTDLDVRSEHGRDWWPLAMHWALRNETPQIPCVVCQPRSTSEVAAVLALCNEHRVPVTASGGRSGVNGAAIPLHGGVVLNMTKMAGIESIDTTSGIVGVLGGTFGPDLENGLAEHGHSVGHFPQSFDISTVGGWIACRGAGQYSTRYGKIEDIVVALEVVLADGSIVRTGGSPAGAVGPDFNHLFIGSEGTLGVVTRAWLRTHAVAVHQRTAAFSFDTFQQGVDACRRVLQSGATPAVLRLYDGTESKRSHGGDGTRAYLLVLDEASEVVVDSTLSIVNDVVNDLSGRVEDDALVSRWLEHRNDTSALQALVSRGYVVDTMEIAAPWSALDTIYVDTIAALGSVPHVRSASCHLSHSYHDGACLYFTFAASPPNDEYEATYEALWTAAQSAALDAGSNLSHHHGIGLNRGRFMRRALGSSFEVLRTLKKSLDPNNILNPGKLGLDS